MKVVKVKKLAISDLSIRFARKISETEIKHYVYHSAAVYCNETEKDVGMCLQKAIEKEMGEPVKIDIEIDNDPMPISPGNAEFMLFWHEEIRKSLAKYKTTSVIHCHLINPNPIKTYTIGIVNGAINYLARKLGYFIYLPTWGKFRAVSPVRYISIAFEEGQEFEAWQALVNDLSILHENGLIMGHLMMPTVIRLADTIGSGKKMSAFSVMPIVNQPKLDKIVGFKHHKYDDADLYALGLKHVAFEGDVFPLNGIPIRDKYKIEEVRIDDLLTHEQITDIMCKNFESERELFSKYAQYTNRILKSSK